VRQKIVSSRLEPVGGRKGGGLVASAQRLSLGLVRHAPKVNLREEV